MQTINPYRPSTLDAKSYRLGYCAALRGEPCKNPHGWEKAPGMRAYLNGYLQGQEERLKKEKANG